MSDYEKQFAESFDEDENDHKINQDKFETCGYCDGAGSLISLLGHSHGTCSYCYGSGIQPRDRH